jgi:protease I
VKGKRTDMLNAGARWEDSETVRDGNMITSRQPSDLDAFVSAIVEAVEGRSAERSAAE